MPNRKAAKNVPIAAWLSAKPDCREGRFIQVGNSLLLSKEFQALTASAKLTYLALCMEAGGKSMVKLSHSGAEKYGLSSSSFDRSIKQLLACGFLEQLEDDNRAQFATNVYRFSYRWKQKPLPILGKGQIHCSPILGKAERQQETTPPHFGVPVSEEIT